MNGFRRACYRSRVLIWFAAISFLFSSLFLCPFLTSEPSVRAFMWFTSVLSLIWAIWSSKATDQKP